MWDPEYLLSPTTGPAKLERAAMEEAFPINYDYFQVHHCHDHHCQRHYSHCHNCHYHYCIVLQNLTDSGSSVLNITFLAASCYNFLTASCIQLVQVTGPGPEVSMY